MAIPSSEVLQRTVQQHLDAFHAKRVVECSVKDPPTVEEDCECMPDAEVMDFEDPPLFREEAPVFFGESPSTASAIERYSQKFPEPVVKDLNPDAIVERCKKRVAEARGVIIATAARSGLAVKDVSPLQVKMAVTGYGKADKRQVELMVRKTVTLPEGRKYDDELDAIAVGVTALALFDKTTYPHA
jgi:hypothetical protein